MEAQQTRMSEAFQLLMFERPAHAGAWMQAVGGLGQASALEVAA